MRYQASGVCANYIDIELEENTILSVQFGGGCNGNLKGISSLVIGMKVDEAIKRLKGIQCGNKASSCPDQLAIALESMTTN
ncbi:MAG: TIGR03905 family TSCPD domain-containing protein [Eubacteriales bacterium]